jgi:hypothetical protein
MVPHQPSLEFFLQLREPTTAVSRKFLHSLTIARRCKSFCNVHNKKIRVSQQQFSVRGSISVTARPRTRAS